MIEADAAWLRIQIKRRARREVIKRLGFVPDWHPRSVVYNPPVEPDEPPGKNLALSTRQNSSS